jgi:hypothetical protein
MSETPERGQDARAPDLLRGLGALCFDLRAMRRLMMEAHRTAFGDRPLCSHDPADWAARAFAEQVTALLRAAHDYDEARACGEGSRLRLSFRPRVLDVPP